MHCPRCGPERTADTIASSARMIEPLHYINNRLFTIVENVEEVVGGVRHVRSVESMPIPAVCPPIQVLPNVQDLDSLGNIQHLLAAQTSRIDGDGRHSSTTIPSVNSNSPPVSPRKISTESEATSITMSEKRRGLRSALTLFKKPPPPSPPSALPVFDHYCFSTDGTKLLLWDKINIHFSLIPATDVEESLEMWEWKSIPLPRAAFVAAGGERVAAVAKLV